MKTLFRTFGFQLLALIAVIVVLAIRGFAQPTTTPSTTPCPDPQHKKINLKLGRGKDDYAELNDPDGDPTHGFEQALNTLTNNGGQCNVHTVDNKGNKKDYCHTHGLLGGPASIKTDKITTSEVARRAQVQGSAANDPNVTWHVTSDSPTDIINVLKTLNSFMIEPFHEGL